MQQQHHQQAQHQQQRPAQHQQAPVQHQQQPPVQHQQRQPPQQQGHPQTQQQQQRDRGGPAGTGGVQKVERGDEYVHVRFRNPDDFDTIRTPDWAAHAAQDIAPGAEVRTGKLNGSGEWHTESALIPTPVDQQTAARLATQIVEKIGE
jgi:hypothetical protein